MKMSRISLIVILLVMISILVTGCTSSSSSAPASSGAAPASGSTPASAQDNNKIATVSAQALYTLPQDHEWHGDGIYDTGQLEEWYYFTGFLTDQNTGDQLGLFFNIFREGTGPGTIQYRPYFSLGDFNTQEFTYSPVKILNNPLVTQSPPGSTSPYDFEYSYGSPTTDEMSFDVMYYVNDTWFFRYNGVGTPYGFNTTVPVSLDLKCITQTPYGYLPMTPSGIESENAPYTGQSNPQNMSALSYYYGAPKMITTGTITVGNRTYQVSGSVWFEHQWGNFAFSQMPAGANYVWSAWQFNNGSIFSFRQWYDQQNNPELNLGRHSFSTPNGTGSTTYGFGQGVVWQGLKTWKSPITGRNYPNQGQVTTPYGTYYYTPIMNPYEIVLPSGNGTGALWEGPVYIRTGSLDGPITGKAFLELPSSLTQNYPELD